MNTPIRTYQVAVAGLDLLHRTRLKLACSLLLSERMDITVRDWQSLPVDLLVVSLEHDEGRRALAEANATGVPVLRISRRAQASSDGLLAHGATVRDINAQLRQMLGSSSTVPTAAQPGIAVGTPLLLQLAAGGRRGEGALHLLQRGAMWLLVDTGSASIALPAGTLLADLCQQLDAESWSCSPISAADFAHQFAYRLPQRQSFEALYFAVAQYCPALLPAPPETLQLRHWPDLDTAQVPSAWLQPIAHLHAASWRLEELARHCRLPRATMASLFAAAACSGVAQAQELNVPAVAPPTDSADSRFLVRLARRLGLGLLRGNHA